MKHLIVGQLGLGALLMMLSLGMTSRVVAQGVDVDPAVQAEKIAAVLEEFNGMPTERLEGLTAREIRPFELPPPGADVMRVRLQETYSIDGIGEDTVELSGWIAVQHTNARPVEGEDELTWDTAVVDTEFVGMELTGTSQLFGEVRVTLDETRPRPTGAVGQITLPERAATVLLAQLRADESSAPELQSRRKKERSSKIKRPEIRRKLAGSVTLEETLGDQAEARSLSRDTLRELTVEQLGVLRAAACRAEVSVQISLPDIGLNVSTLDPVGWFSIVDTIPPVGHTASIAIDPVPLVTADGRRVGTLTSGKVGFREVVRTVLYVDPPTRQPEERMAERSAPPRDAAEADSGADLR